MSTYIQEKMTYNSNVNDTDAKPKIMTGYIHYDNSNNSNNSDDLTQLFKTLNDFRKNNGLKYSHQGNVGMIFFNVSSEHLEKLYKQTPYKISKFQTRTEYDCDKETADKLMGQKDSFVRMNWDEETNMLTFMSRTTSRVHGNLVRRIFKDSELTFDKTHYRILRDFVKYNGDEQDLEQKNLREFKSTNPTTRSTNPTNFVQSTRSTNQSTRSSNPTTRSTNQSTRSSNPTNFVQSTRSTNPTTRTSNPTNFVQSTKSTQEETQLPDGFQRVTGRYNKKTNEQKDVQSTPKVVKENENTSKPKVRGSKVSRNNV